MGDEEGKSREQLAGICIVKKGLEKASKGQRKRTGRKGVRKENSEELVTYSFVHLST